MSLQQNCEFHVKCVFLQFRENETCVNLFLTSHLNFEVHGKLSAHCQSHSVVSGALLDDVLNSDFHGLACFAVQHPRTWNQPPAALPLSETSCPRSCVGSRPICSSTRLVLMAAVLHGIIWQCCDCFSEFVPTTNIYSELN